MGRLLSFSSGYGDKERISRPYARFFCNRDRKNQVALRLEKGLSRHFLCGFPDIFYIRKLKVKADVKKLVTVEGVF